jgi:hypothetical protein
MDFFSRMICNRISKGKLYAVLIIERTVRTGELKKIDLMNTKKLRRRIQQGKWKERVREGRW